MTPEICSVFVKTEKSKRFHMLVMTLGYWNVRNLQKARSQFDLPVEEGLGLFSRLSAIEMTLKKKGQCV